MAEPSELTRGRGLAPFHRHGRRSQAIRALGPVMAEGVDTRDKHAYDGMWCGRAPRV
ncbi:hypothetical protein DF3PB_2500001 [uncultured Defluviicoccus sp.]|uniref:Uncharacterized protein n=1 Tax=metagenome TaxID=256318 RepID=A0A380TEX3_9ZZZZ|nr:hypothetical protein DF3PB_2500001 [uncultured Defluviicoccus sp.]